MAPFPRNLLPPAAVLLLPLLGACLDADDGDDGGLAPAPAGAADITTDITADRTLDRDTVYTL